MRKIFYLTMIIPGIIISASSCSPHIQGGSKPSLTITMIPRDSVAATIVKNIPPTNIWSPSH